MPQPWSDVPWSDPQWPDTGAAERADLAACRALLRGGSRSFFVASCLLPERVSAPASALYAFCRLADDAVDVDSDPGHVDALQRLGDRLDRVYQGRPLPIAADRALARVVTRHGVPRALLDALLEGFGWDAQGRRYEDLADLLAYAARVAGSVGAMMAVVMGVRTPALVARACDLGMAMQLSNIARDVGEDARAGRLYLPLRWLREAGLDPETFLGRPHFTPALGEVIARLLHEADALYARGGAGIAGLPRACRPGIAAARFLYAGIGEAVARRGLDSVAARARVPAGRKAALVARAVATLAFPEQCAPAPPHRAALFLVRAVAVGPPAQRDRFVATTPTLQERIVWVLDLFARLEQRDHFSRSQFSRGRS